MSLPIERRRLAKRLKCVNPATGRITCRAYYDSKGKTGDRCKRSVRPTGVIDCIRRLDQIGRNPNMAAGLLRPLMMEEVVALCCYAHAKKGLQCLVDELCAAVGTYRVVDLGWQPADAGVRRTVRPRREQRSKGKKREKGMREKGMREKRDEKEREKEQQAKREPEEQENENREQEKTMKQVMALTRELRKEREMRMDLSTEQIVALMRQLRPLASSADDREVCVAGGDAG